MATVVHTKEREGVDQAKEPDFKQLSGQQQE